ncbi:MAG: hypothetical protein K5695_09050 [Oscillospiraceae bacterium]|nr:hypothetical protein [Oscillospiraceae bacterium]
MAMMAPKEFLERLNAHTEEEQIQIMTNILKWADETQIARQEAEMYKRTADKLSDQIVQLKVEAQVAARMQQPAGAASDPALKEENEKLRQEIERLKTDTGDAAGWAVQKQQYEDRIKILESQLEFQTNRANGLADNVQAEHEKYEAEHATCEGLAAQLRKLNDEIAQPNDLQVENDQLKKKIDAHILANRELQEKIKGYEKEIKNAQGAEKKISNLQEELLKRENELKKQVAATAKETKRVAEWEEECKRLQGIIDLEHEVSAQKRAIREAKTTGAGMRLPGESVSMQGVGGTKELPKQSKSAVPHMFSMPPKGGAARSAAPAAASGTPTELEKAKKQITELQEKLIETIEEKETLAEKLQNLAGTAAAADNAAAAPAADTTALADENAVLKQQLEELRKKSGGLEELDSLKTVNATQKMQLEKLTKEKEALDEKVKALTNEVNQFKSDSADAKTLAEEKTKLLEENEKLKKQVETLGNEITELKKQLAEKDKQLAGFLKEEEAKKKAEEAERAAANDTYEMRMSTLTSEVEKHQAKYLSTNSGFEGRIRIKANAPRKKSYFVLVDGQVFPNPYLFREMTTGKQSFHTLQQLKTLFDMEGLDNENMTYRLVSVKPAVVFVPDGAATDDTFELKEKGKLKVEKQV